MVLYISTNNNRRERQKSLYHGELLILVALSIFHLLLIKVTNPSTAESNRKLRLYSFAIKRSQCDHFKKHLNHPTLLPQPWDLFPTSVCPSLQKSGLNPDQIRSTDPLALEKNPKKQPNEITQPTNSKQANQPSHRQKRNHKQKTSHKTNNPTSNPHHKTPSSKDERQTISTPSRPPPPFFCGDAHLCYLKRQSWSF